jgi:hypothetical protein
MDFLETVAFLGASLVGLIALGATFLALWRGAPNAPVFLHAMLSRQGADVARIATASGSREFAIAVNRCLCCNSAARCRAWLDSGKQQGFEAFCANAGYVSRLRALAPLVRGKEWT